jgi:hypothetical protein
MVSSTDPISCNDQIFVYVWGVIDISCVLITTLAAAALAASSPVATSINIIDNVTSLTGVRSRSVSDALEKRDISKTLSFNKIIVVVITAVHVAYYIAVVVISIAQSIFSSSSDPWASSMQNINLTIHTLQVVHQILRILKKYTLPSTKNTPANSPSSEASNEGIDIELDNNPLTSFVESLPGMFRQDTWQYRSIKVGNAFLNHGATSFQVVLSAFMMMNAYYRECN